MTELKRRSSDVEIIQLIERVEQLDSDVKQLKKDFDDHIETEATKIELLIVQLTSMQVKLDQLLIDIKEPMETYKAAKAGASFMKYVVETAKWAAPLILGLTVGYNSITIKTDGANNTTTTITKPADQGEKK